MPQEYPLPRYSFKVDWDGVEISCSEVTGLVMEREKIEYRHGDSKEFGKITMPGLVKNNDISLKRGTFEKETQYKQWLSDVNTERVENRRDVNIKLLNEKGDTVAAWTAKRCFPIKFTAPDLKSDANEIAIESLDIAHEGLVQMDV
jgi:phage tail-like protein